MKDLPPETVARVRYEIESRREALIDIAKVDKWYTFWYVLGIIDGANIRLEYMPDGAPLVAALLQEIL